MVGAADGVPVGAGLGALVVGDREGGLVGLTVVGDSVGVPVGLRFGGYSRMNSLRSSLTNIPSAISKASGQEKSTMVAWR